MSAADELAPEVLPEDYFEIIDGELVEKQTTAKHSQAQANLVIRLGSPFGRRPGGRWPGGWIFATEALIYFDPTQKYRPDVAGWRRERVPSLPDEAMLTVLPDWICEILSPGKEKNDLLKKMRTYFRAKVQHYWIVDPVAETLAVHRWTSEGYLAVLLAERGETVKAEPFGAIDLQVGVLFGEDEQE